MRGDPARVRGHGGRSEVRRQGHEDVHGRVQPVPPEHRRRGLGRGDAVVRLLRLQGRDVPVGRLRRLRHEHAVHMRVQGAVQPAHHHVGVLVPG